MARIPPFISLHQPSRSLQMNPKNLSVLRVVSQFRKLNYLSHSLGNIYGYISPNAFPPDLFILIRTAEIGDRAGKHHRSVVKFKPVDLFKIHLLLVPALCRSISEGLPRVSVLDRNVRFMLTMPVTREWSRLDGSSALRAART